MDLIRLSTNPMRQILEIFLNSRMIQKGSEELRERESPPAVFLIFFLTNYFNAKSVISWVHAPIGFLEMTGSEPPASRVDTVLS